MWTLWFFTRLTYKYCTILYSSHTLFTYKIAIFVNKETQFLTCFPYFFSTFIKFATLLSIMQCIYILFQKLCKVDHFHFLSIPITLVKCKFGMFFIDYSSYFVCINSCLSFNFIIPMCTNGLVSRKPFICMVSSPY